MCQSSDGHQSQSPNNFKVFFCCFYMTINLAWSIYFYSHLLSINYSTFGTMVERDFFTLLMCSNHGIVFVSVLLSNVFNNVWNLCHEKLRQFWGQKSVPTGISKLRHSSSWLYITPVFNCLVTCFNSTWGCCWIS